MPARRRGFARRGPRRQTDWSFGFLSTDSSTIPANSKVLLASLDASLLDPLAPATVIRTRGSLFVGSDQAAAFEVQTGGIGLTFVSEQARAAGVASLPSPLTNLGWDGWLWIQLFTQMGFQPTPGATGAQVGGGMTYEIDSKAMRKFTGDDALVLVADNAHATMGLVVFANIRMLVKAG